MEVILRREDMTSIAEEKARQRRVEIVRVLMYLSGAVIAVASVGDIWGFSYGALALGVWLILEFWFIRIMEALRR
jgi:fatty acid desaturase